MDPSEFVVTRLRRESRRTFASLARESGLPASTLFDAHRRLEGDIILRHVALLDFAMIGLPLCRLFVLAARDRGRLLERLRHPAVNTIVRSEGALFLVEALFSDSMGAHAFREGLRGAASIRREIDILVELRREEFIPL